MSHITETKPKGDKAVTNMTALQRAAARCGLEFREGQKQFKKWGASGQCDHAMTLSAEEQKKKTGSYPGFEIGIRNQEGGAYTFAADHMSGAINKAVGRDFGKLLQFYQAECLKEQAEQLGDMYQETVLPDGSLQVEIDTTVRVGV